MKHKIIDTIDVAEAAHIISRAGRSAGVNGIARLCNISNARCKKLLTAATAKGLVYTYGNVYRNSRKRTCYAITKKGMGLLECEKEWNVYRSLIDEMFEGMTE